MEDNRHNPKKSLRVKEFKQKRRQLRELAARTGDLSILEQQDPHYHLMMNGKPDFSKGFETQTLGMKEMSRIRDHYANKDEDKVLYYEEGMIRILEAKLPGRTGTHDVMLQLGICARPCANIRRVTLVN